MEWLAANYYWLIPVIASPFAGKFLLRMRKNAKKTKTEVDDIAVGILSTLRDVLTGRIK